MIRKVTMVLVALSTVFLLFAPTSFAGQRVGNQVVEIAFDYSDGYYVFGGTGPNGFDCSGFTQFVFSKVGIDLNRTSRAQYSQGVSVSRSNLQPGDLLFFNYYSGGSISHVGIYIGNNKMISAENPGDDIVVASVAPWDYWGGRLVGAKRVIPEQVEAEAAPEPLPVGVYHDVSSGYWAYDKIKHMSQQGIITGYAGDIFNPEKAVTRAEVAKMISEALNLPTSTNDQFSDVNGHWAEEYINGAAMKGYINGYKDGSFKPDQPIEREEVASLFKAAFNLSGVGADFADVTEEDWSYYAIQALATNDITKGYPATNEFKPQKNTTRAEFATFLYRALYQ